MGTRSSSLYCRLRLHSKRDTSPLVEWSNRRTSFHVGPLSKPSYFGMAGLRIPRPIPGAHQPRVAACSKNARRAWPCDASVTGRHPSAVLSARKSSTTWRETEESTWYRVASHCRKTLALELYV